MGALARLLDALLPPRCAGCGVEIESIQPALCGACERDLPWWRRVDGCPRCGASTLGPGPALWPEGPPPDPAPGCASCLAEGSALHSCQTLLRYAPPVDRWLPAFKSPRGPFGPPLAPRLAVETLSDALAWRLARVAAPRPDRVDRVVPVPLHWRRRARRGFNHAELVAARIGARLGHRVEPGLLVRVRATQPQAGLTGEARRQNPRGAFRATQRAEAATRVWLVDDVLTTGSTLDAAADALLEAGVIEVHGVTLAATLPPARKRRAPSDTAPYAPRSPSPRPRRTRSPAP